MTEFLHDPVVLTSRHPRVYGTYPTDARCMPLTCGPWSKLVYVKPGTKELLPAFLAKDMDPKTRS